MKTKQQLKEPNNLGSKNKQANFSKLPWLALLVLFFFAAIPEAHASHGRYGNIEWSADANNPNTIHFKIKHGWAYTWAGWSSPPQIGETVSTFETLEFGDGNSVPIDIVVLSYNLDENWLYGEFTTSHTYANIGDFTAYWERCCRINALENNAFDPYRNETLVNVGTGNNSPIAVMPAILNLGIGLDTASYQIFSVDPDGDNVQFRLATTPEYLGSTQPSGFSVSPTGLLEFNTSTTNTAYAFALGQLYNAAIVIEDLDSNGDVKSRVTVDFLIKIIDPEIDPPVFSVDAPAEGSTITAYCGQEVTFTADVTGEGVVTLATIGLPIGSVFTPALPVSGNQFVQTVFTWTPNGATIIGNNLMAIIATDDTGPQTTRSFNILVIDNTPDNDGDGYTECEGDCNDNDASINPGASEIPYNGIDDDCNPSTLDDDLDEDGFNNDVDCDDNDATIYPGAPELCDGKDNDCDGDIASTEIDDDGDGYSECQGDCDDSDEAINPDATEILDNGIDDNCDGFIDVLNYCTPEDYYTSACSFMWLTNVTLGDINNTTDCGGIYSDFSDLSTELLPGNSYPISVTGGGFYNQNTYIYVDWNLDGDFDDAGEAVDPIYTIYNVANNGSITVPSNVGGSFTMRVISSYELDANPGPCGSFYGEVEDYTIEVLCQDPVISCLANINACATSAAGAVLTYTTPVVTYNCGELTPVLVSGLESGSVFPIGETTVRYEATDAANNTLTCEFTVTVAPIPNVDPIDDIVVCVGEDVSEIIFAGNLPDGQFTWTNDNPDIGLATDGSGNISGFTATNTTNASITANITVTPATPDYLYMSTTGDNRVSVINTLTNTIVATIPVGSLPYGTSASVDGTKVYITNRNDNSVSVIDTATNTLEATIDLGARPSGILASPDGTRVYVGVSNGVSGLAVIDTSDNTVTEPALVGYIAPWGNAVSPDGTRLYATVGSSISVINTSDYSEVNIPIPGASSLFRYAISPDGSTLYVTDLSNNAVSVIDTVTKMVVETITVAAAPNAITISPDGSKVYVSIFGGTTVDVINTADNTISASIEVGSNHGGISVSSDGAFVYLARQGLSSVTVINTATNTVVTDIAVNSSTISYGNFVSTSSYCAVESTTFSITVNNLPINTAGIIASTTDPIQAGTGFNLSADFNVENLTSAIWYFSDDGEINSPSDAELTFNGDGDISGGVVSGAFNFDATLTGVYTVKVVAEDACGTAEATYDYVVIYDPTGGFVTGGGWFDSPEGALVGTTTTGKANFGFNAKYRRGNNNSHEVDGNTNFQFKEGDFHFKSSSHDDMSLVISGERKATYRGSGTVNGAGYYGFMVTVVDGEAPGAGQGDMDTFRIKIWTGGAPSDVVYDNELGNAENADASTGLGGGSIVIHKPRGNNSRTSDSKIEPLEKAVISGLNVVSWPNPSKSNFNIRITTDNRLDAVDIQVIDITGKRVHFNTFDSEQSYKFGENLQAGVYFVRISQGNDTKIVRLIKR